MRRRLTHYHKDEAGLLRRCFHTCRNVLFTWQFWLGTTMGFPIEHWLWTHVWPFYLLTHLLGL